MRIHVCGEGGVGKTTFVLTLVKRFDAAIPVAARIGVRTERPYVVEISYGQRKIRLYDYPGQAEFREVVATNLAKELVHGGHALFIGDCSRPDTITGLERWAKLFDGVNVGRYMVINKVDVCDPDIGLIADVSSKIGARYLGAFTFLKEPEHAARILRTLVYMVEAESVDIPSEGV